MGLATSPLMGNNQTFLLGIFKGVLLSQVTPLGQQYLTPLPPGRYIMVHKPPWDNIPMVKSC